MPAAIAAVRGRTPIGQRRAMQDRALAAVSLRARGVQHGEESGRRGDCHVEREGFGCGVGIGGVALQGDRDRESFSAS